MSTLKGKVKWFNGKKGYGFIERSDGEKDCFVHASSVREAGLKFLNEGDQSSNVRLENNDLIIVGPYTNRVSISDGVKIPGKFEIKKKN